MTPPGTRKPQVKPTIQYSSPTGITEGLLTFARPTIPFARLSPEWNRRPSALLPGFAPRRYQQRTPGQGQAHGHWPGITPSNSLDLHLVDPLTVWDFVSHLFELSCSRHGYPLPSRLAYRWLVASTGP